MRKLLILAFCLGMSACSWVELTTGGEKVRVLAAEEVTTCQELGKTVVSSMAKVAGINRSEEKIEKELAMLARNAAADMGGDTVVPVSEVKEGKRSYTVYKCIGVLPK